MQKKLKEKLQRKILKNDKFDKKNDFFYKNRNFEKT